jgi:uncharacterized membrane protein
MKKTMVLLAFIMALSPVYAQEIQNYQAVVTVKGAYPLLNNPGEMHEKISLTFTNYHDTPLTEISYPFTEEIKDIIAYDSEGELEYTTTYKGGKTYITATFRRPIMPGEEHSITYEFTSAQIRKSENIFIMTTTHSILANIKNFELAIALPEGYVLAKEGVSPEPRNKISDGRRVILLWDMEEPISSELRGEFKVIVLYERIGWYPSIYQLGTLFLILLGAVLLFRYARKGRKEVYEKIDILKEDEQAILKIVAEIEGIEQRKIQEITGFSKAKVSKILSELEKREVIRKEQVGRKNKIFLTKKLKET